MEYKVELETFRGPLDLLLFLVKRNEVDICDIPIAKITEQFLDYLNLLQMIDVEGAKVIFASSFGYFTPHVLEMAKKYPNIQFMHCGGPWKQGDRPNICSYFGYIDECQYVSGIVAGHEPELRPRTPVSA